MGVTESELRSFIESLLAVLLPSLLASAPETPQEAMELARRVCFNHPNRSPDPEPKKGPHGARACFVHRPGAATADEAVSLSAAESPAKRAMSPCSARFSILSREFWALSSAILAASRLARSSKPWSRS